MSHSTGIPPKGKSAMLTTQSGSVDAGGGKNSANTKATPTTPQIGQPMSGSAKSGGLTNDSEVPPKGPNLAIPSAPAGNLHGKTATEAAGKEEPRRPEAEGEGSLKRQTNPPTRVDNEVPHQKVLTTDLKDKPHEMGKETNSPDSKGTAKDEPTTSAPSNKTSKVPPTADPKSPWGSGPKNRQDAKNTALRSALAKPSEDMGTDDAIVYGGELSVEDGTTREGDEAAETERATRPPWLANTIQDGDNRPGTQDQDLKDEAERVVRREDEN
jgi:hypothetical protein